MHFFAFQSISSRLRHTFFFENFREREAQNARERSEPDASVLVRLIVSTFNKKSFSAIILFFRNCVCCERLWPLRPSNLVVTVSRLYTPTNFICVCVSVCLSVYMSVPLLRLISRLLLVGFWSNLVKMLELWYDWLN